MGHFDDHPDEGVAAEFVREGEGSGLVPPHQRCVEHESGLEAEIEDDLHGLDGIVAAVPE